MTTDKQNIQALAEVCRLRGIRQAVFAPGSRSAPLVVAFSQVKDLQCMVVPDERVAAFFALGIAQQQRSPVAIVCTSGTAVLNFAPAICEAFYQQVPLLILTADRPTDYIGIGENQAIDQTDIYRNYIKASFTLPETASEAATITAKAITETTRHGYGPVHINIPLREPLYGHAEKRLTVTAPAPALPKLPVTQVPVTSRTLLICGMLEPDAALYELIRKLSATTGLAIITEPLANLHGLDTITHLDATLAMLSEGDLAALAPDTIITIGKQIVSKRIRQLLRKVQPAHHYHLSDDAGGWNGLGAKEYHHVVCDPVATLAASAGRSADVAYRNQWMALHRQAVKGTEAFGVKAPFCDWQVFQTLTQTFPKHARIQYGNSSPIRYAGFFHHRADNTVNANRGTSGIDGSMSAAAGAALQYGGPTICVLGDVSFLYDSNALWNNYLSPNLRIIVINNGGGNIFRLIDGPQRVEGFSTFFETRHQHGAEHLAQMYQIPYYFCDRADDLEFVLGQFYKPQKGRPAILEIKTDGAISEKVYKDYFTFLGNIR
ncbi:MAG: 2-succinyl-5-enolpyruvyl-6-hydroxy-3-cyclohexene-1-carboxylic-acid synthase [Bacteroidetes bacterium]|nr:2-succinyl-5-enolpyruvyl-6-hydroxy-3-cyclohexene-1-carboxylic-acid synthase [Bacteroidota bacterium]